MSSTDTVSQMLSMVLICMIALLMVLLVAYLFLKVKDKNKKKFKKDKEIIVADKNNNKGVNGVSVNYNKQSIFKFMEFDDVIDNMIVQKGGKKYAMVIECQGINYDLMSRMEKTAVEEGFQQFLNTLRHPIQIYIQTRTINLENSIKAYKEKVMQIENDYNNFVNKYNQMKNNEEYSQEEINKSKYELTKKKNLLEYGKDVIYNTEKMSLNNSVLTKKYYIVLSYVPEDVSDYIRDEVNNMAFSELYTKSQAIIRTLSGCSVQGKILNSYELLELLYVAYNREDSEVYSVEKALQAQYEDLYSTSVDVLDKKMNVLNKEIEERATEMASKSIERAKSAKQKQIENKENDMERLIEEMAKLILEENKAYVGADIINEAQKDIIKKRGEVDVQEKKETRGRKSKNA